MDEFENFGEQPDFVEPSFEENNDDSPVCEQENEIEKQPSEAERGVPIGKFKSVDDLMQAYNNLQAEFTRKSQKLAELEKDKTKAEPTHEEKMEVALKEFLFKNQEAVVYADELRTRVEADESLRQDEKTAFDKVWAEFLYEKLSSKNLEKEPLIQNLILKNDGLQNLVIQNYMKQLQEQKIPYVMSSNAGERVTKMVTRKPDTFEEAKKVVFDLFGEK